MEIVATCIFLRPKFSLKGGVEFDIPCHIILMKRLGPPGLALDFSHCIRKNVESIEVSYTSKTIFLGRHREEGAFNFSVSY
jgi:hypothetical protein